VARILPQVGTIVAKELMRNYCDTLLPRVRARARTAAAAAAYREVAGVATARAGERPIGGIADTDRRLSREALNFGGKNAGHICARTRGRAPNPSRSMRTGSVGKFSIYQLVGSGA